MHGYPPAIIRKGDRLEYFGALEKAQLGGSKTDYDKLIIKAAARSLDIYLKAALGKTSTMPLDKDELLRIGALAKRVSETVPTIRHWTKEGLLQVAKATDSGYQLFSVEMVERCKAIQKLKNDRLTLAEIKQALRL
jgi:hypothetical protein